MNPRAILTVATACFVGTTVQAQVGWGHVLNSMADGYARGAAIARDTEDAKLRQQMREEMALDRAERESSKREAAAEIVMGDWKKFASLPTEVIGQRTLPGSEVMVDVAISLASARPSPDGKSVRLFMVTNLTPVLVKKIGAASMLERPSIQCITRTISIPGATFFDEQDAQGWSRNHLTNVVALSPPFSQPYMDELVKKSCRGLMMIQYDAMLDAAVNILASEGIDVSSANRDNAELFDRDVRAGGEYAMKQGLIDQPPDLKASADALRFAIFAARMREHQKKNPPKQTVNQENTP